VAIESAYLQHARIVVIGAGAVGSVTAYRLAQAGADVTIVDCRYPGSGTTGNSFAWINSFGKSPQAYHRLNTRSMREHRDLATELPGDWLHTGGGLAWESSRDEPRSALLREKADRLRRLGYRIEALTPEQATRELDPDLAIDPEEVDVVYYTPMEGWIDGVGLCHSAVRTAVQRYGACLVQDTVTGFATDGGSVTGVRITSGETLPADAVINAAGPQTPQVMELAEASLPMTLQPGLLITTRPAPVSLRCIVHTDGLAIRSEGGSRLMVHSENGDSLVESDTSAVDLTHPYVDETISRAAEFIPNLKGIEAEGVRVGVRPMPKDGLPIIGFDPEVTGFYHLVMHSGVTLSAVIGGLVVEDLMGIEPPELSLYRPERFTEPARSTVHATDE
jgi:glycine/D-amino acid oxidase-like deaminating enzyme